MKNAVYFFCDDPFDPVAGNVLAAVRKIFSPEETSLLVDGLPVLACSTPSGESFHFVRTLKVVSHDYSRYLPVMADHFSDCDLAGIITWHEGENAPDGILTIHTTGDVDSGVFGPADPECMRNLLLAMERARVEEGLADYRVITEATHWSGMVYGGGAPGMILQYPVPLLDIEIGSSPRCWGDERAARVLARSLLSVFRGDGRKVRNILCAGGVHFDPNFAAAAFVSWDDSAFGVSHILANQWLVAGRYDEEEGADKLARCVASIRGGVSAIAFHDNLKGPCKDRFRALGKRLGIPVVKHQALRSPEKIQWR